MINVCVCVCVCAWVRVCVCVGGSCVRGGGGDGGVWGGGGGKMSFYLSLNTRRLSHRFTPHPVITRRNYYTQRTIWLQQRRTHTHTLIRRNLWQSGLFYSWLSYICLCQGRLGVLSWCCGVRLLLFFVSRFRRIKAASAESLKLAKSSLRSELYIA